ncbi:MAG: aryl-sulfate sulfotransferase [Bacteroidetes bacterium]|nr:aryl-sulfate sulfotransferase [Bacteroidota bacterium]
MKKFGYVLLVIYLFQAVTFVSYSAPTHNYLSTSSKLQKNENDQITYISPMPDAALVMPQTNIIIRTKNLINPSSISGGSLFIVRGFQSGLHSGKVILADDQKILLFQPYVPFSPGEKVSVTLNDGLTTVAGGKINGKSFSFTISPGGISNEYKRQAVLNEIESDNLPQSNSSNKNYPKLNSYAPQKINGIKDLPDDFPAVSVTQSNNPTPGYIFLSNFSIQKDNPYGNYLMILDNSGDPVFYRKMPADCFDFKVQPTGLITYFNSSAEKFYGMNSSFAVVDSFSCSSGYTNDVHELLILPNGKYFLLADDFEKVDMSQIVSGGNPNAIVTGIIIQELDKNGNVIFQWRSWDHFKITDATHEDLTAASIDYVHSNAIDIDTDGNLFLSSRHIDEITKINIQTGDIIWRLGGKNNQFDFLNDNEGFSHQHAVRRIANGDITLFEDGNFHNPPYSRAVEYKLDEKNMTATLVWQ